MNLSHGHQPSLARKMSSNIDDFNIAVATILAELYRNFPNKISLCAGDFPMPPDSRASEDDDQRWQDEMNHWFYLVDLYNHTAYFLLEEGYIRGSITPTYTPVSACCLTSKGLAALQKIPRSLKERNRSIGDVFLDVGKDALKDGAKELIKSSVLSLLSGH